MARGKKFIEAQNKVDQSKLYSLKEAFSLLEDTKTTKFDESVEVAVKLGIDPRQANQQVRGAIVFPHGIGKKIKVLVFTKGEKVKEAEEAGADYVGAEDLIEKITKESWLGFDVVIATPDIMGMVGKLGKFLGPRGLMPSPKVGTVTFDIERAVRESKAGRIEFKNDKGGVVHAPFGKISFGASKLRENFLMLMDNLLKMKPPSSKGTFIRKVVFSNTMGPGIKVDFVSIREALKGLEAAA